MNKLRIAFSIFLIASVQIAWAAAIWDADSIVAGGGTDVNLMNESAVIDTVSVDRIRQYTDVRDRFFEFSQVFPKVLISSGPEINAYATSENGQYVVIVTLAMMKMVGDDKDAAAMLIGHEIAHLAKEHGPKRVARNTVVDILAAIAGVVLDKKLQSKGYQPGLGGYAADLGGAMTTAAFSRDDEREADALGTDWMVRAGFDPLGGIRLFRKMSARGGGSGGFLGTHPSGQERIDAIMASVILRPSSGDLASNKPIPFSARQGSGPSPPQQPKSAATASVPIEGQVGLILKVKPKYGYAIFSGTTPYALREGYIITVLTQSGQRVRGTVSRSLDGYYSAMLDGNALAVSPGDRVEISVSGRNQ